MSKSSFKKSFLGNMNLYYHVQRGDELKKIGKEIIGLIEEVIAIEPNRKRILIVTVSEEIKNSSDIIELSTELLPKYIWPYVNQIKFLNETLKNSYPTNIIPIGVVDKFKR